MYVLSETATSQIRYKVAMSAQCRLLTGDLCGQYKNISSPIVIHCCILITEINLYLFQVLISELEYYF